MKTNETHILSVNKVLGGALLSLGLLAMISSTATAGETPREKLNFNPVWRFTLENDSTLTWRTSAGRAVSIQTPQLTLTTPGNNTRLPFKVELRKHSVQKGEAVLEYELSLNQGGFKIAGSGTLKVSQSEKSEEDILLVHTAYIFNEAVTANVETVCGFDVQGEPARQMGLPERNGYFRMYPILPDVGGAGRFDLGNAAKGCVT